MPLYQYFCTENNHLIEDFFPMGEAPSSLECKEHSALCQRHFGLGLPVVGGDEFRKAWLSSDYEANCAKRGWKDEYAPKDKSEVKAIQEKTGRVYMGNNIPSNLNMPKEMRDKYNRTGQI